MSDFYTHLTEDLPAATAGLPVWMAELRQQGADNLRQHGLPTRRDESWKYTRLGFLDQRKTRLADPRSASVDATAWPVPIIKINKHIKLLDGALQSVDGEWPEGISVWSLQDALSQDSVDLPSLLQSLPAVQDKKLSANGFSALNNATLDHGVVIHVAKGVDAGRILFQWSVAPEHEAATQNQATGEGLLFNTRICLVLEAGASLQWMEHFESTSEHSNSCNVVVQIELGEGASLRHCRLQHEAETAGLITRTEVNQQSQSDYAYFGFDLGGGLVRHDLHSSLRGENAGPCLLPHRGRARSPAGCYCKTLN